MTTCSRADAGAGFNYPFLTQKERDNETGLDYFEARYYANSQGRFTGVDPLMASAKSHLPQSWNRYSYCLNNPLAFIDPSGLIWGRKTDEHGDQTGSPSWYKDEAEMKAAGATGFNPENSIYEDNEGRLIFLNPKGPDANGEDRELQRGWWQVGRIREPGIDMMQNQAFDLAIGNASGKVLSSIIGRLTARFFGSLLGGAADATTTGVTETITNPIPSTLARVIPGDGPFTMLGRAGAEDVFVTAADDISGLNAGQLGPRLGIRESEVFNVIEFRTPRIGLASPINRADPGFVGFGRTIGGAREFVVPNGPIPANAVIKVVH